MVGLIELYHTLLNKAETMSLLQGIDDADANQQLLLAVERLADLYNVLGDEAYADALNPTIGFGSNFTEIKGSLTIDYGAASSSLFCFDNQVASLLDEELALVRGRDCLSNPNGHTAPYYNRLLWNFTKGITAGEVAYVVNYGISGHKSSTLTAATAAEQYPQGHGDAFGHYLSALQGYYRLLRNPYFSWGTPCPSQMNVADSVVNVDYYDEATFAKSAANVAKAAKKAVELTALKTWRDNLAETTGGGYTDANATNAFGYGEWAVRGAYGALCNWAVANSLLPKAETNDSQGVAYVDQGLTHIDRQTVAELQALADAVDGIERTCDRMDAGKNPLGLDANAVPFDLTPIGDAKDATHFEQVRARAGQAFENARQILDRAYECTTKTENLVLQKMAALQTRHNGVVYRYDQIKSWRNCLENARIQIAAAESVMDDTSFNVEKDGSITGNVGMALSLAVDGKKLVSNWGWAIVYFLANLDWYSWNCVAESYESAIDRANNYIQKAQNEYDERAIEIDGWSEMIAAVDAHAASIVAQTEAFAALNAAQFDSTWYATKISKAGVWFEGYNEKRAGYTGASAFATTPNVYLVPVGTDKMRVPGTDANDKITSFNVVDQTIPAPYPLTAAEIAEANWLPTYSGETAGADAETRIRRHPSFRAYFGPRDVSPNDSALDAVRLVGRSVWNTKWILVIPAGALNANRDQALKSFIYGLDTDRDGKIDVLPVKDIKIGFKTYSAGGK